MPAQFLLFELGPDAYALVLPLVSGDFRASVRGKGEQLLVQLQSGDPDVRATRVEDALLVAAGDDPYALVDEALRAAAERLGTFGVGAQKKAPKELDQFGWCTWDAFYSAVDPAGIEAGLASLQDGHTPARMLILDDGWQSVAQEGSRGYRSTEAEEGEELQAEGEGVEGVRIQKRERAQPVAQLAAYEAGEAGEALGREITSMEAAAAAAAVVSESAREGGVRPVVEEDEDEEHVNNPADMKGYNPLHDLVSEWYRNTVHGAHVDSMPSRLWQTLAHTLLRGQLERMFDEQTDFSKRLISFAANEKFESPAAGTSLGQAVGQWKSKYGLERVYAWHTIGGYWGGVSTLSPQFAHLLPAQVQPTPTKSLLEVRPAHAPVHPLRAVPPTRHALTTAHRHALTTAHRHALTTAPRPPPRPRHTRWSPRCCGTRRHSSGWATSTRASCSSSTTACTATSPPPGSTVSRSTASRASPPSRGLRGLVAARAAAARAQWCARTCTRWRPR